MFVMSSHAENWYQRLILLLGKKCFSWGLFETDKGLEIIVASLFYYNQIKSVYLKENSGLFQADKFPINVAIVTLPSLHLL